MVRRAWVALLFSGVLAVPASADEPVDFDTRKLFSCREIKPPVKAALGSLITAFVPGIAKCNRVSDLG